MKKPYKRKKPTLKERLNYTKYRLESLESQFKKTADEFVWIMQNGNGIKNIYMLEKIRALNFLYTDIAAHKDALRSLDVEI